MPKAVTAIFQMSFGLTFPDLHNVLLLLTPTHISLTAPMAPPCDALVAQRQSPQGLARLAPTLSCPPDTATAMMIHGPASPSPLSLFEAVLYARSHGTGTSGTGCKPARLCQFVLRSI